MKSAISVFISFNFGNTFVLIRNVLCVSAEYFDSDSDTLVTTLDYVFRFPSSCISLITTSNTILWNPEAQFQLYPDEVLISSPDDILSFSDHLWSEIGKSRPRLVEGRHKEAKDLEELLPEEEMSYLDECIDPSEF